MNWDINVHLGVQAEIDVEDLERNTVYHSREPMQMMGDEGPSVRYQMIYYSVINSKIH